MVTKAPGAPGAEQPAAAATKAAASPSAPPDAVRLFVGGLAPGVAPADVAARFCTFGAVAACEVVPAKDAHAGEGGRGCFGYLTLAPKDGASLGRCLSLVRGFERRAERRAERASPLWAPRRNPPPPEKTHDRKTNARPARTLHHP
jgi:hypothetical protein